MFKRIPGNIVSWLGKTSLMPNYWPSRSVLRWKSVFRNHEIRNMVLLCIFGLLLTCFLFSISLLVWRVYDWKKNYCIKFVYANESNQLFPPCPLNSICDESGLTIEKTQWEVDLWFTEYRLREGGRWSIYFSSSLFTKQWQLGFGLIKQ